MSRLWTDGDWTLAKAVGNPIFSAPIPGVSTQYVFIQAYVQNFADFAPMIMGQESADYPGYYLVEESPREDLQAGVVRWNRKFCAVPEQHIEAETTAYNFIGFFGTGFAFNVNTPDAPTGRQRFTQTVPVRAVYDYFRLDGVTYSTPQDIPVIEQTQYLAIPATNIQTDFLQDSPPLVVATDPSFSAYSAMIAADAASANSFSIVSQASIIERWMGKIFRRCTRYVKAI